jgi:tRNA (guanine37-N1)-methyltransferase
MKQKISVIVLTLFPDFVESYTKFGIIKRAMQKKILSFRAVNLRDYSFDRRGTVDDRPYGGGLGMVLRPDVMIRAIQKLRKKKSRVILLTPQGKVFNQAHAKRLAKYDELIFVSGRYEGFDERIRSFVDEELSVGDYVLMGGELPSLVVSEAVLRLIPGVLGKLESTAAESFAHGLLEYPQYTKPEVLKVGRKTMRVPKVLLAGHHAKMNAWREAEAIKRTKKRRPDLLK